ncbi:SDR family oxidoreductase [Cohnella lupini]|uniref:NAD(P)-dependent dehydrogenase (Short-subunit alcohol dehydrogenase family) n=1 Tax=Cohnella lupini TaxID=1294267 RepID=A0A3D9IU38_9BACL|nr:SDR family NAD(P)-dependent oxidoreductase [Cohnella lupini]RED64626.1 NAD(P)-dependent dehydrogenase (short-subunit alcohol dehydrogenase family) [Cohnella lupini]
MVQQQQLKGKVALVTGGGSGIGRGAALRLAEHGAYVCVIDRERERAEIVREEIVHGGGEAVAVEADVSNADSLRSAVVHAAERWGRLDIVFANAGINGTWTTIEDLMEEDWDRTIDINLKGTFLTLKYSIPYLKRQGGSVIITSSVNGNRIFSNIGASAYSTSKAGQVAFMQMAALELAEFGIRVNAICPGAIKTNIGQNTNRTAEAEAAAIPVEFPEGSSPLEHHAGSPEQVADLVLFLASPQSSLITGTKVYIDGAESLLKG